MSAFPSPSQQSQSQSQGQSQDGAQTLVAHCEDVKPLINLLRAINFVEVSSDMHSFILHHQQKKKHPYVNVCSLQRSHPRSSNSPANDGLPRVVAFARPACIAGSVVHHERERDQTGARSIEGDASKSLHSVWNVFRIPVRRTGMLPESSCTWTWTLT